MRAWLRVGAAGATALTIFGIAFMITPTGDWRLVLSAGEGRVISERPAAIAVSWTLLPLSDVRDACALGDTVVSIPMDGRSVNSHLFGTQGAVTLLGSIRVASAGVLACDVVHQTFLVVDQSTRQLYARNVRMLAIDSASAPRAPQSLRIRSEVVPFNGGWIDSWLATDDEIGPYLSDVDWQQQRLLRKWASDGHLLQSFGTLSPYKNPVARRRFNRPYLAVKGDTLWTLTEGDAVIKAFDRTGRELLRIALPIYEKGHRPVYWVGPELTPRSNFRNNKVNYRPSVAGLALLDSGFVAIARLIDWRIEVVGPPGGRYLSEAANSLIELIDRSGRVVRVFTAPGHVQHLRKLGSNGLLLVTQDNQLTRSVQILHLR